MGLIFMFGRLPLNIEPHQSMGQGAQESFETAVRT